MTLLNSDYPGFEETMTEIATLRKNLYEADPVLVTQVMFARLLDLRKELPADREAEIETIDAAIDYHLFFQPKDASHV